MSEHHVVPVMFFMHVRYSTRLIPLVAACGIFWLLILLGITMSDYLTRGWLGAGAPWPN
jgi:cytochrome c oxidase subunit 4